MPPPQQEISHITIFFSWVSDNIAVIVEVLTGVGLFIALIFRLGKRKKEYENLQADMTIVKNNQQKVIGLMPQESWIDGVKLMSAQGCQKKQVECEIRLNLKDDRSELSAIKEAVGVLIFHSKDIPPDEREKQYKALMK